MEWTNNLSAREPWSFDTPEVALPEGAGVGRMEQLALSNGLHFYRTEFRVERTCTLSVSEPGLQTQLCSQVFLMGENSFRTRGGGEYRAHSDEALVYRIDPDVELTVPGGQVVRHVGVCADIHWVKRFLSADEWGALGCFQSIPPEGAVVRGFALKPGLRKLATQAFSFDSRQGVGRMALEGVALSFYAQILTEYIETVQGSFNGQSYWQGMVLENVADFVGENLDQAITDDVLARRFGVSRAAIRTFFQEKLGLTVAEYLRQHRMRKARRLLVEGQLPAKAVAQEVGYRHVSNFNAAYKNFFGETPGGTQRLECR